MASATKEKVAKALAEVKKENEDFEFNIFESGDFLQLLQTTNNQQDDSPKKTDDEDEQPEPDENEPDIEDEPDPDDEDEGKGKKKDKDKDKDDDDKDNKDDDDKDDGKKKPKNRELRVGDKVRVKSTGRVGVITQINDDGTYVVSDDGEQLAHGGEIIKVFDVGGEIGTFEEDELEVISEEEDDGGDDDGDDDDDDSDDPDAPKNPNKKGKKKKKKKKKDDDPDSDDDPDIKDPDDDTDDDDDDSDNPDAPPRPPRPVDIEEIKRKYRKIRTHTFKLPLFAKTFFNADLNSKLFYDEQAPLVLFNRAAKDVLNPKKNMTLEAATSVTDFNLKWFSRHVPFLREYLHYVPDANGQMVYMINPQKRFEFPPETSGILSLEIIEQMLDMSDPDVIQVAIPTLLLLEKIIVDDNFYYRILSLSAVLNPEYFSQNYLKTHLDFLRKYFYTKYLTFCSQENIFTDVEVTQSLIYDSASNGNNLLVINAIGSDVFDEDYILYVCRNIISITGEKLQIDRIYLKDASENDRAVIVKNLTAFYVYSMYLKSNSNAKKTVLGNMKKFGTLQGKSYENFLTNIQILTFSI